MSKLNIKCPDCGKAIKLIRDNEYQIGIYDCECAQRTDKDVIGLLQADNAALRKKNGELKLLLGHCLPQLYSHSCDELKEIIQGILDEKEEVGDE